MKRAPLLVPIVAALLGLLVVSAGVIVVVTVPRPTTFNLTAETEWLEMVVSERVPSWWRFENVRVIENDVETETAFDGYFEIGTKVRVTISRVALGPLTVYVECLEAGCQVGRLRNAAETPLRWTSNRIEFIVADLARRASDGASVLLPVTGAVIVGRPIGIETGATTAILRSGRVTMLGRSVFKDDVFEAGAVTLDAGDQFLVEWPEPKVPTLGFVVLDERPAMTAAVRVAGRRASITRPGGSVRSVSASLLGRLIGDDIFKAASGLLALATALATLGAFALQVWPAFSGHAGAPAPVSSPAVMAEPPQAAVVRAPEPATLAPVPTASVATAPATDAALDAGTLDEAAKTPPAASARAVAVPRVTVSSPAAPADASPPEGSPS